MSHESYEEKFERQLELEAEMSGMGITRFRKLLADARARGAETTVSHGQQLLKAAIDPTAQGIREFIEKASSGKAGRRHAAAGILSQIEPDVAAFIIAKVVLDQITFRNPIQAAAIKIGSQLDDEMRFRAFEEKAKGLWVKVNKQLKTDHQRHRERVLIYTMNKVGLQWADMDKTTKLHLGMKCIELFCTHTGLAETKRVFEGKNNSVIYIEATPATMEWITEKNARSEVLYPVYLPCVIKPKPWTTPYNGGYHSDALKRMSLVKTRNRNLLEELNNRRHDMLDVYHAINTMQSTAWKINTPVLDVMTQVWETGNTFGKVPPREDIEIPPCPLGEGVSGKDLEGEEKERFVDWKKVARDIHDKNAQLRSKRLQVAKIITIAERFKEEEAIFFPYSYDFRGRVYATPMFLNPQGADVAKGLLTFAKGKPLATQEAADWLAIHGANVFGYDKAALQDRVLWAYLNTEKVMATTADPLGDLWWTEADKPWQFLAWCYEWRGYQENGLDFVSSLPIALDGSCNGLQHYSAALRDSVGGRSVNLIPSDVPQDIYQDVADVTVGKLRLDVSTGASEYAQKWLDWGISRKDTKRSVMVLPYGGTLFGTRKFIEDRIAERLDAGEENIFGDDTEKFKAAAYLAKLVWASIGEVVIAARGAMDWLQKSARVLSKEGLPITWSTPDGFCVMQAYPEQKSRRVKTQVGNSVIYLTLKDDLPTLDKQRQANGIAPNYVHSMDGTALRMCVNQCAGEGVTQFAMVHDSYGTYAADTAVMAQTLREAFVKMYQENDVLAQFKQEVGAVLDEGELPELPVKGDLDLADVLKSEFFFA